MSKSLEELIRKCRAFRQRYYGKDPGRSPTAESAGEAFDLIEATLFGHIYQRPAVDIKTRSLCTIAALTVLNHEKQLPNHITGALNSGVPKQVIVEIITQMLFCGGYPCAVNGLSVAQETFDAWDKEYGKK
jgi:alkylhydroperoxidase/carboxymuconolactone decarboxylase family protein YurZ